nr:spore coat associated protein CotJA [uncultured Blautia sp.]
MENYQMSRSGCRPYNRTCGMMTSSPASSPSMRRGPSDSISSGERSCSCNTTFDSSKNDGMYECLRQLAPTMAYVPYQRFTSAYDLNYALSVGTIFPQLCKPFCGKRGGRR